MSIVPKFLPFQTSYLSIRTGLFSWNKISIESFQLVAKDYIEKMLVELNASESRQSKIPKLAQNIDEPLFSNSRSDVTTGLIWFTKVVIVKSPLCKEFCCEKPIISVPALEFWWFKKFRKLFQYAWNQLRFWFYVLPKQLIWYLLSRSQTNFFHYVESSH